MLDQARFKIFYMRLVQFVGQGGDDQRSRPPIFFHVAIADARADFLTFADVGRGLAVTFANQNINTGKPGLLPQQGFAQPDAGGF